MAWASRAICWPWCAEICMPACFILPVSSRNRRFSALSRSQLASTYSPRVSVMLGQVFISITSNVIARALARGHLLAMKEKLMTDIKQFVDRYINIWNEPDDNARRQTIRALWQEDARHLARTLEAIGHAGIETRVKNAYDKWVKEKGQRLSSARWRRRSSRHDQAALGHVPGSRRRCDLGRLRLSGAGR